MSRYREWRWFAYYRGQYDGSGEWDMPCIVLSVGHFVISFGWSRNAR